MNDTILRPADCRLLDYEIELALVLKEAINKPIAISESDLPRYVGAVVMCNDVSARDIMFGAPMLQWFRGKSQRTFNKGAGSSKGQSIAPGVTYSGDKYIIEASNPATAFIRSLAVLRDYYDALDERDQKMIRSIEGWVEEFESTDAE